MANTPVPNSTGQGWSVTAQQETTDYGPDNMPARGYRVSFITDRGLSGSVFVPLAMYNPANVKAAIMDRVQLLHSVHDLTG